MDIVTTEEGMRGNGFFGDFDLNTVMVKLVLLSANSVCFFKNTLLMTIITRFESNMARERVFVVGERPNVNVVHLTDSFDLRKAISNFIDIQMHWGGFENQNDTLPES